MCDGWFSKKEGKGEIGRRWFLRVVVKGLSNVQDILSLWNDQLCVMMKIRSVAELEYGKVTLAFGGRRSLIFRNCKSKVLR